MADSKEQPVQLEKAAATFLPKKPAFSEALKPGMAPGDVLDAILAKDSEDIIPWEECTLPSRGVYYNGKIPGGVVEARAMGIYADKILATARLAKTGKSLDWLFRKCVKFPAKDFDPLDLLAGDRIFLLYFLRGITHGNEYDFMITCTNQDCKKVSEHEYDLHKLFGSVKLPNQDLGPEPFKVVLPYLSEVTNNEFWVKVRLIRGRDTMSMLGVQGKGVKRAPGGDQSLDETLEQNLNLVIVDAMGSTDPRKIKNLVDRMHSRDTATIREFLRENSPGIDTNITVECECGHEMTVDLPITESFFRPKRSRRNGA